MTLVPQTGKITLNQRLLMQEAVVCSCVSSCLSLQRAALSYQEPSLRFRN